MILQNLYLIINTQYYFDYCCYDEYKMVGKSDIQNLGVNFHTIYGYVLETVIHVSDPCFYHYCLPHINLFSGIAGQLGEGYNFSSLKR